MIKARLIRLLNFLFLYSPSEHAWKTKLRVWSCILVCSLLTGSLRVLPLLDLLKHTFIGEGIVISAVTALRKRCITYSSLTRSATVEGMVGLGDRAFHLISEEIREEIHF